MHESHEKLGTSIMGKHPNLTSYAKVTYAVWRQQTAPILNGEQLKTDEQPDSHKS